MSHTINNIKRAIAELSDRKTLQKREARFIRQHKVLLTMLLIIATALASLLFFFTNCLLSEIAIAVIFFIIFLVRAYIQPSIKRISVMILSLLPVLFFINLYGHLDITPTSKPNEAAFYKETTTTPIETGQASSISNTSSIVETTVEKEINEVSDTPNHHLPITFSAQDTICTMSLKIISEYLTHKTDWIAIIIAVYSLIYAIYTWRSQEKTQQNTQRITPEIQKGILKDFFRHSYRNLIVLAAMKHKLEEQGYNKFYPADYHLLKLHTDENSIYPETFVSNDEFCARMHEFKLIVRNGNLEIDTIKELLKDNKIEPSIKRKDLMMINSRINLIVKNTASLIKKLYNISDQKLSEELEQYFEEGTQKSVRASEKEDQIKNAMDRQESVKAHLYARANEDTGSAEGKMANSIYCEALVDAMFPPCKIENNKKEYDKASLEKLKFFMTKMNAEIYVMLNDIDLIHY